MIVFDLICRSGGHVFEAWFGSSADYDRQQEQGLIECPLCGAPHIEKAVMAPRVGAKGNKQSSGADAVPGMVSSDPEGIKHMLTAMAAVQKQVLEQSEYVGRRFADEARAIYHGDAEERAIYGQATNAQTECLIEEGISVAPLPFPVIEPDQKN